MDLTEGADLAVAEDDAAAFDEVLVRLGAVEAADDGPDGGGRSVDVLDDGRAALVGADRVGVVAGDGLGNGRAARLLVEGGSSGWGGARGFVDAVEEDGGLRRIGRHGGVSICLSHSLSLPSPLVSSLLLKMS